MHSLLWAAAVLAPVALLGMISAFEAAVGRMNKIKLKHDAAAGRGYATFVKYVFINRERFLGFSLLVATTSVVCSSVATMRFWRSLLPGVSEFYLVFLSLAVVVPLSAFFGEMLPRMIATRVPEHTVRVLALPVRLFYGLVYYPFVPFAAFVVRTTMRLLGAETSGLGFKATRRELMMLLKAGGASPSAADPEGFDRGRLISSIFSFSEKRVEDAMVPLERVMMCSVEDEVRQVARVMARSGYSRLPVYREERRRLIGLVHVVDVLSFDGDPDEPVGTIMRPVFRIRADMSLPEALRRFKATRNHLALVRNEGGVVVGIITLEDLLEEIIGDIEDEFDSRR